MVHLAPMDSRVDDIPADDDVASAFAWSRPGPSNQLLRLEPSHLSALEQSVVALAQFDPLSTTRAPGPLMRLLRGAFGIEPPNRLANKRLEVLRRYSVILRERSGRPEPCEVEAMKESGFSEAKIREVDFLIARASIDNQSWTVDGSEVL